MFITTRIANGIFAVFTLLIIILLRSFGGSATIGAIIICAGVVIFFITDLCLRIKDSPLSVYYTLNWIAFYAYFFIKDVLLMSPPEDISLFSTIMFGVPLLLNGIYLCIQLFGAKAKK